MSAKIYNFAITQDDEKAYNLAFTTGIGDSLLPIDITGATVTMTVKKSLKETELAFPAKVVTQHTDAVNGKTTIILSETDTSIPLGTYYYDIQINGGSIRKKTVLKGELTITWQATEG